MHEVNSRLESKAAPDFEVMVFAKAPIPISKPKIVTKATAWPKFEPVAIDIVKAASKTLVALTIEQLVKLATIHTKQELASIDFASHF